MKKFRLILAAVTAAEGIYMIYANWSVRGYHLLEMNAAAGHRAAVTYRWAVVLFLILGSGYSGRHSVRKADP